MKHPHAFKAPKASVLERVRLIRRENPHVAERLQRLANRRRDQRSAEEASDVHREMQKLHGHLRHVMPHAKAADVHLRAQQLHKRFQHLSFT